MGISDKIEIPAHKNVIQEFVGNKKDVDIKKIAFLGSKKEMLTNRHPDSVENFVSEFFETNETVSIPVSSFTALFVAKANPACETFPVEAKVKAGPNIAVDCAQPDKIILATI